MLMSQFISSAQLCGHIRSNMICLYHLYLSPMTIKNMQNKGTPAGVPLLGVVGEAAAESLWPKHPPPGELPRCARRPGGGETNMA